MLVISTQNWSILVKFAPKNPAKSAVFYWLFLGQVSPQNFPWNRPIFLRICTWKSFEIWLFSAKIPRNWSIFLTILTFLPRKSREISRFFSEFAPENPTKFCFFFREISEALYIIFIFHHLLTYWFCKPSYTISTWIVRNKLEPWTLNLFKKIDWVVKVDFNCHILFLCAFGFVCK